MKSFVLRHEILCAVAALILVGPAVAACGGGGAGHSPSYKAGYDFATQDMAPGNADAKIQANATQAGEVCGMLASKGLNGANDSKEWIQGCADAVTAHKAAGGT